MKRLNLVLETLFFGVASLLYLGPVKIWRADLVIGRDTRDLYDHLALLDCWSLTIQDWAFPDGGVLFPPDLFSMLFASPFMFLGRGVAFDIAIFVQLWLCCIAGAHLGRCFGSGLVGGLALGFSPYFLGQVFSGETETLSVWPLVLMMASLIRAPRSLWTGFWAALSAIGSWYYGAYAAIILVLYMAVEGRWFRKDADYRQTMRPILFFLMLIVIPAIGYTSVLQDSAQMFRGPVMETYVETNPRALAVFSSDPYVWFGGQRVDVGHQDRLGMLVPLLFLWGVVRLYKDKERRLWLLLLVLCFALCMSLGPILHWNGQAVWSWMPYRILMEIPPLGLMRLPHRWMIVVWIILVIFIARASRTLPRMWGALLMVELIYFSSPRVPNVYIQAPAIQEHYKGPVLEFPARMMSDDIRGKYLLWQKEHRQPIPYSLLMQGWNAQLDTDPLFVAVTANDRLDPISIRTVEAEQFRKGDFAMSVQDWQRTPRWSDLRGSMSRLQTLGFRQVCLHRSFLHPVDALEIQRILEASLGTPFLETEEAVLWML
ncbi:MAG: hypothetical protein VX278_09525 [Myxococcota bacterium]|nr:hypothetical protein [Myxococcota bacterium]